MFTKYLNFYDNVFKGSDSSVKITTSSANSAIAPQNTSTVPSTESRSGRFYYTFSHNDSKYSFARQDCNLKTAVFNILTIF